MTWDRFFIQFKHVKVPLVRNKWRGIKPHYIIQLLCLHLWLVMNLDVVFIDLLFYAKWKEMFSVTSHRHEGTPIYNFWWIGSLYETRSSLFMPNDACATPSQTNQNFFDLSDWNFYHLKERKSVWIYIHIRWPLKRIPLNMWERNTSILFKL